MASLGLGSILYTQAVLELVGILSDAKIPSVSSQARQPRRLCSWRTLDLAGLRSLPETRWDIAKRTLLTRMS